MSPVMLFLARLRIWKMTEQAELAAVGVEGVQERLAAVQQPQRRA